jgi:DNA-binding NtrC family response regulator
MEKIEADPPDAVFLDVQLPGINGLDVLRKLRASHPDLPVVMISGHATIERAVESTRLGAFEFVEKPFSRDRILLLARNAAEAGRMKRELARLRGAEVGVLSEPEFKPRARPLRGWPRPTRVLILARPTGKARGAGPAG